MTGPLDWALDTPSAALGRVERTASLVPLNEGCRGPWPTDAFIVELGILRGSLLRGPVVAKPPAGADRKPCVGPSLSPSIVRGHERMFARARSPGATIAPAKVS